MTRKAESTRSAAREEHEAARAKREAHNLSSSLVSLPAELRNEIYYMCVSRNNKVIDLQRQMISKSKPGLLQTCRLLRSEALPFYYFNNSFGAQIYDLTWQWDWNPDVEVCIRALPDVAFACFSKVQFRLEARGEVDYIICFPRLGTNVDLWHNGLPAILSADKGLERHPTTHDFLDVKSQIQVMVNRLNQRPSRKKSRGVCKDDVLFVLHMLKRIIDEDERERSGSRSSDVKSILSIPELICAESKRRLDDASGVC